MLSNWCFAIGAWLLTGNLCNTPPRPQVAMAPSVPASYTDVLGAIEARRDSFNTAYQKADSVERTVLLDSARNYVFRQLTIEVFPRWYGTPWDFNGTTTVPGQGTIACGYFITTTLQQVGFDLPRFKWAQLAAEPMIRKMADGAKAFSDRSVEEIATYLEATGDGLYAVGLDNHVGFIVVEGDGQRFVHSNYYQREIGVMSEPLEGNNPFAHSRYRVIGQLLGRKMMERWVLGLPLA
ncbi:MAG: hypothetical protein IPO17_04540 [Flavobacteriales bacterium]|nr:hypothetical protein [Flavobacteriales bacterium]MBK9194257.1 hypothetical protein [Flavobacteriales bacterium]